MQSSRTLADAEAELETLKAKYAWLELVAKALRVEMGRLRSDSTMSIKAGTVLITDSVDTINM
jgi:hypothetical protein